MEPVCFQSMPLNLLEELIHTFFAKLVIDLTPGDAKFGWACLRSRVSYIGMCFNDAHCEFVEARLLELLKGAMLEESSGFYNISYAKAMGKKADAAVLPTDAVVVTTAKAKAKALAAQKKK